MRIVIPIAVIAACVVIALVFTHKNAYREGFMRGKQFILCVMRRVSPSSAEQFSDDMRKQYQYDIFSELNGKR